MLPFLKLIRWVNLLCIGLTQYLLRYCVILPLYAPPVDEHTYLVIYESGMSHTQFFLLVLSTILVAAAGYIINDYMDVNVDAINKPQKQVIDKNFSRQEALWYYGILNGLGIAIGFYVASMVGNYRLGFLHILSAALLWFYSTTFKRKWLIGNLIIAFLASLVVLIVGFFEEKLLELFAFKWKEAFRILFESLTNYTVENPDKKDGDIINLIFNYLLGYALFAFLLTWIREIVKDIEDIIGDEEAGYTTLPITFGLPTAKLVAAALLLLTINWLVGFQKTQIINNQLWLAIVVLFALQLPLLYLVFRLWKGQQKSDFTHISKVLKVLMFVGLLYLPYFYTTIQAAPPSLPPNAEPIDLEEIEEDSLELEQDSLDVGKVSGAVRLDTVELKKNLE